MADFSVIKEADAPKPARTGGRLNARMAEYEGYVASVRRGQVGRLAPGQGESARGIALRISRAARRAGKEAQTWTLDGVVYFLGELTTPAGGPDGSSRVAPQSAQA